MKRKLTDGLLGYLTPQAEAVLKSLMEKGLDQDLAVILIDQCLPEDEVWMIDNNDEQEEQDNENI